MARGWRWLALGGLLGAGCVGDGEQEVSPEVQALTERDARVDEAKLREAVQTVFTTAPAAAAGLSEEDWTAAKASYAAREHRPLWVDGKGPSKDVRSLLAAVCDAEADGLRAADYDTTGAQQALETAASAPKDPRALAQVELALTGLYLQFARDLSVGRITPKEARWGIEGRKFDPAAALKPLADGGKVDGALDVLRPKHPEYGALKKALAALRELEAKGGWPELPKGKALEPGARDPRVALLRQRLHASGELDSAEAPEPELYDEKLAHAVRVFQARHGLEQDAVVGGETLSTLRVPVAKRIDQVIANLERWRWMPDELGERAILVNVPAFELQAREGGRIAKTMRVIVGLPDWETPVFASELDHVVFKPQWAVPKKILSDEILPKMKEDAAFAAKSGLRVYSENGDEIDPASVDWSAIDPEAGPVPYKFRQPPGGENPLGHVKFLMPNRFAIYLHDTPNDRLFEKAYRSFSHGCIRVEKPVELTQFALRGTEGWDDLTIQQEFEARGRSEAVKPSQPPRVYLTYFTAFVDDQGVLQLRTDLYKRDRAITWLLQKQRAPEEKAPLCG